jgi:hypothetical protein
LPHGGEAKTMMELTIDQEFRALIPPLTEEERVQLEANLLNDGVREALVVWHSEAPADAVHPCQVPWVRQLPLETMTEQVSRLCPACGEMRQQPSVLLDGHHRYEICQKHGLTFIIMEAPAWVKTREDAMIWIIQNQVARRNLEAYQRAELALKLEPLIAARAKAHQQQAGGAVPPTPAATHGQQQLTGARWQERLVEVQRHVMQLERPQLVENLARTWGLDVANSYSEELVRLIAQLRQVHLRIEVVICEQVDGDPQFMLARRLIELTDTILHELATWRQQFPADFTVHAFGLMEHYLCQMQDYFREKQRAMPKRAESVEVPATGTTGQ